MGEEQIRVHGVSAGKAAEVRAQNLSEKQRLAQLVIIQETSSQELCEWDDNIFNPLAISRRFRPLSERARRSPKGESAEAARQKVLDIEKADETADKFAKRNPELDKRTLLVVQARIKASDTAEEILAKVLEAYPDPSLADETLDYLLELAESGSEVHR